MELISYTKKRSVADFTNLITATWIKATQSILEVASLFCQAELSLSKPDFRILKRDLISHKILSAPTISKLLKIGKNVVINKEEYSELLPPSYETLYRIISIEDDKLVEQKLISGHINNLTQQKDIPLLFQDEFEPDIIQDKNKRIVITDISSSDLDKLTIFLNELRSKSSFNVTGIELEHQKTELGQYDTCSPIANKMVSLFEITQSKKTIHILDAGSGSGILGITLIKSLIEQGFKKLKIDLFEIDDDRLATLKNNLTRLVNDNPEISIDYRIIADNFILYEHTKKYDLIITNPPYVKIAKHSKEAMKIGNIVQGSPNLYALFIIMSIELLKKDGQFVCITPRSFTSGKTYSACRKYLLSQITITDIHLYKQQTKIFKYENINEELLITKMVKLVKNIKDCSISTSDNPNNHSKPIKCKQTDLIKQNIIRIPTTKLNLKILKQFDDMSMTIRKLGYKVSVGSLSTPKHDRYIYPTEIDDSVPIIWTDNIIQGDLYHPVETDRGQYIKKCDKTKSLFIDNDNVILIKRVSHKIHLGYVYKSDQLSPLLCISNNLIIISGFKSVDEMEQLGDYLKSNDVQQYLNMVGTAHHYAIDFLNLKIG